MATLDIIIGPMFAGKSCELIQRIRKLKVLEKEYLVIKPIIDNRYSNNEIVSHNFDKEKCVCYKRLNDIYNTFTTLQITNLDTVFIDEGQFFPDLKNNVLDLVENYNINVVVAGLDGDFKREKFGEILDLIPYSTTCKKINALCKLCKDGTPALFTYRTTDENDKVLIGGKDNYMAICRKHYLKFNKKNI